MPDHRSGKSPVSKSQWGSSDPPGEARECADALLSLLKLGEISQGEYLEQRIESAILPFKQAMTPDQLEFLRETLRGQIESDPLLVELAHRATDIANGR